MNFIWNMGLSGSILGILYLLTKSIIKKRFSDRWRYRILKCILLYYLIPLPFLKNFYLRIWKNFFVPEYRDWVVIHSGENLIFRWGDELYLNSVLQRQIWIAGIWIGIAGLILLRKYIVYFRYKKNLFRYSKVGNKEGDVEFLNSMQKFYLVKQKVGYIDSTPGDEEGNTAFTLGVLRPIVLYPEDRLEEEKRLILGHELIHIKQQDVLWRMLMSGACVIHWYNPIVWWLVKEFEWVGEMACDERLLQGGDDEEKRRYAELLLKMSKKENSANEWHVALSRKSKRLKERMEHVMKKKNKCFGGIVSAILVGVVVFMNSFTVLAYEDINFWNNEAQEGGVPQSFLDIDISFVPDGGDMFEIDFMQNCGLDVIVLYDSQFVDETGNIYPVQKMESGEVTYAVCNHQYVTGTFQKHVRNSSGGCTITVYVAQRCTKCGFTVVGEEVSTATWKACNH